MSEIYSSWPWQFNRETLKEVENQSGRVVAIACDGSTGRAATLLGLSDEFIHQSCKAYGACAAIERYHQRSVPTAETRAHNLTFDLGAYGNNGDEDNTSLPPHGFHLKLFGSVRHRYMALAVPKCESKVVKTLKMALYQSVSILLIIYVYFTFLDPFPIAEAMLFVQRKPVSIEAES